MKRKLITVIAALTLSVTGCATGGTSNSSEAKAEKPMTLRLAHNLSEQHVTSVALKDFAQNVEDKSNGRIKVQIFPSGQLGNETEVLEQLQAGVVDMTRVSAPGLATYDDGYHAFGLPYVFADQDEFYRVMDSPQMREYFESTRDSGFVTLTYFTSGARSFYTKNKAIREPADLKGMKIRIQNMQSQSDMMLALNGTPVVIPFGDIYTSLQTGIIDGAESNETALTLSNHGEVSKVFSYDEHAMIPDILVISTATWDRLTPEDQELLVSVATNATENHKVAWDAEIEVAVEQAKEMGVEFIYDIDKQAFQDATSYMLNEYAARYPGVETVLTIVGEAR